MLLSLALIILCGMTLGGIFQKLKLPNLLGMLLTGILLGPYVLNLLSPSILSISTDIRQIALIIILTRAGLALDIKDLIKVGRPALLMCAVPACFEIVGMIIIAPSLLHISVLEAAILGSVIAAVSPAIIVPKMLMLMDGKYGTNKSIPQMIMAGASVDDVFVIVLFTSFTGLAQGQNISAMSFIQIPISIVLGVLVGVIVGLLLLLLFKKMHIRDSGKVLIILSISFLLVTLEQSIKSEIAFSGLLAVMSLGATIQHKRYSLAIRISNKFSKLWVAAEVFLFVLVGASVNLTYVSKAGLAAVLLIVGVLFFRMIGVYVCLLKTNLDQKERLFCMIAYSPKATVQAAIGSLPLAMGLPCGEIVLAIAVMSILISAPLGALAIDLSYKKLLVQE